MVKGLFRYFQSCEESKGVGMIAMPPLDVRGLGSMYSPSTTIGYGLEDNNN
jgi:hypothetical protein